MTLAAPYKRNTIVLKGFDGMHEDAPAGGAISPGHLIMRVAGTVVVHATLGGECEKLFAKEDALQGHWLNDAYATGDIVSYYTAMRGDHILGLIAANAPAIADGDPLVSNGAGALVKATATTQFVVAHANGAIDNSAVAALTYTPIIVS